MRYKLNIIAEFYVVTRTVTYLQITQSNISQEPHFTGSPGSRLVTRYSETGRLVDNFRAMILLATVMTIPL